MTGLVTFRTLLRRIGLAAALIGVSSSASGAQRADTIVVQAGAPLHPGVATLVEELTLGAGSTAPEYTFTHAFVFPGRDGSVYVLDMVDPTNVGDFRSTVRQYDRTGKYLRTFGRIGQGPGEYIGGIGDVEEMPDGRVLLSDRRGILVYSATGEPITRWNARGRYANTGEPMVVTPEGFVYLYAGKPRNPASPASMADAIPIIVRFRPNGTLVDTVAPPEASFPDPVRLGRTQLPFAPRPIAAPSRLGGFVVANTGAYEFDQHFMESRTHSDDPPRWAPGARVIRVRHSEPPIPVQDAERADWRQSITMYNRSPAPRNAAWSWTGPDIPTVKPFIRSLMVDRSGRTWVRLHQPARLNPAVTIRSQPADRNESYNLDARDRWVEPAVFDIFESSGKYVGRVRFPDELVLTLRPDSRFAVDGDVIWGIVHDKDDVPTVKRYRIRWGR